MLILKDLISENLYATMTNSQFSNSDWLQDGTVKYVVADNTELATKILAGNEFGFNYIEDEKGNLIDVTPISAPLETLKERKVEEINEKFNAELSLGLPVIYPTGTKYYIYDELSREMLEQNLNDIRYDFTEFRLGVKENLEILKVNIDEIIDGQRQVKEMFANEFSETAIPQLRAIYNYLDIYRLALIDWVTDVQMTESYLPNVVWGVSIPSVILAVFPHATVFNTTVAKMESLGITYTFRI